MIVEFLVISSVTLFGYFFISLFANRSWAVFPLSLIAGVVVYGGIVFIELFIESLTLRDIPPLLTFTFTLVFAFFIHLIFRQRAVVSFRGLVVFLTILATAILLIFGANLARFHSDSLNFMMIGNLIFDNELDAISAYSIETRLSLVPVMYSLGNFADNFYLRTITPLISISLLAIFWWLFTQVKPVNKSFKKWIGLSGLALLATNHAYLFHSFYINGHLLVGTLLLLGTGATWLLVSNNKINNDKNMLVFIAAVATAGLVLARVEGFMYAALFLLPLITHRSASLSHKQILLVTYGTSMILLHIVKIIMLGSTNSSAFKTSIVSLLIGVAVLIFSTLIKWLPKFHTKSLYIVELLLWLTPVLLFFTNPYLLTRSLWATFNNVAIELDPWGYSIIVLATLVITALTLFKIREQHFLRFASTAFIPIVFILPYLSGGPYRIHNADSLNRMLIQFVPLAVFYVVVAFAFGTARFKWLQGKR